MKATAVVGGRYRVLVAIVLIGIAAIVGGQQLGHDERQPTPQEMSQSNLDLLALHRLADPSPFRCSLCRFAPDLERAQTLRVSDTPIDCEAVPAGMSRI